MRWTACIKKVSVGKHMIDHAVGTTIMGFARHVNVDTTENAAYLPR